jgi:hypothetical protein
LFLILFKGHGQAVRAVEARAGGRSARRASGY